MLPASSARLKETCQSLLNAHMQALLDTIATLQIDTSPTASTQRVFHGRGGCYPGSEQWTLDWFGPVWLLTSFKPVDDDTLKIISNALAQRWAVISPGGAGLNLVFQCRGTNPVRTQLMAGVVAEPHNVWEGGAQFRVHVLKGQNHGLFLDMANARQWVCDWVGAHQATIGPNPSLKVLNLFAYTCAFSVAALRGGAKQVTNVDMSAGALALGQLNHQINGLHTGASFLPHDIFKTWGKIKRAGPFHLVIVDPPSFQKGSFVATKDYAKLIRRLPELLRPGGVAMLCLNAPELDTAFLSNQVAELAPQLVLLKRLANPHSFPDVNPERALKVMLYKAA